MKKTNREIVKSLFNKLITFTEKKYSKLNHNHDSRYYTQTEMDTKLSSKSNTNHTHTNYAYRYTRTNGNFNDITNIGFYQMNTPTSNTPKGNSTTNYSLIIMGVTNGFMQIALEEGTTNMWVRSKINGVWSTWNTPLENAYAAKSHTHSYAPLSHEHDARYYTETEIDTKLASKSNTNHTHSYAPSSHDHDSRYYTETEMDTKLSLKANTNHTHSYAPLSHDHDTTYRKIVDSYTKTQVDNLLESVSSGSATTDHNHDARYYTETEVDTKLSLKANTNHTHSYAPLNHDHDTTYYTQTEMDTKLSSKSNTNHTHTNYATTDHNHDTVYAAKSHTHSYAASNHNHDSRYYTETEMDTKLSLKANVNHTHTNYATTDHNHDTAYMKTGTTFTKEEINKLLDDMSSGSAATDHNHDARYYTETEMDTKLSSKSNTNHTHTNYATTDHNHDTAYAAKSHTHSYAASNHVHDDRYYTETEIETKLASKSNTNHTHSQYAVTTHNHDSRYYTQSQVDTKLASKSDTTHTHDDRYYTETEMDGKLAGFARTVSFQGMDFNSVTYAGVHGIFKPSANSPKGDTTTSYMLIVKRVNSNSDEIIQVAIEHNTTNMWVRSYNGSTWSAWSTPLSNNYAAKSHSHSQYASSTHNHDSRYYTQTEVCTAIAGAVSGHNHDTVYAAKSHTHSYAASNHNHDSRYYTETEMDTKLSLKANVNHTHSDDMTGTILFNGMVENFPHIANGCGYGTKIILTVTTKIKLNKLFGTGSTACNNLFFGGVISECITLKVDGVMSTARANEHKYDNFHNLSYLFHIHITNMETGDLDQERQKTINSFYAGSNDQYGTGISEFGNGDDKPDMFYRYTTSDISSYNETPHTPYIGIALLQYTSLSELSGELTVTFITTFTTGMAITKVTRL